MVVAELRGEGSRQLVYIEPLAQYWNKRTLKKKVSVGGMRRACHKISNSSMYNEIQFNFRLKPRSVSANKSVTHSVNAPATLHVLPSNGKPRKFPRDWNHWSAKMLITDSSPLRFVFIGKCPGHCRSETCNWIGLLSRWPVLESSRHSPLKICSDSSRSRQQRFSRDSGRFYPPRFDRQTAILYSASLLSLSYHQATYPSRQSQLGIPMNGRPTRETTRGISDVAWSFYIVEMVESVFLNDRKHLPW